MRYGNRKTTATNSNYPFQYTGRVPVSSNLYYYRARFYNTATGRFISEDPLTIIAEVEAGLTAEGLGRIARHQVGKAPGYLVEPDRNFFLSLGERPNQPQQSFPAGRY